MLVDKTFRCYFFSFHLVAAWTAVVLEGTNKSMVFKWKRLFACSIAQMLISEKCKKKDESGGSAVVASWWQVATSTGSNQSSSATEAYGKEYKMQYWISQLLPDQWLGNERWMRKENLLLCSRKNHQNKDFYHWESVSWVCLLLQPPQKIFVQYQLGNSLLKINGLDN